jgi:hypothetical protein
MACRADATWPPAHALAHRMDCPSPLATRCYLALLTLCLALDATCFSYLYYSRHVPSFHLQWPTPMHANPPYCVRQATVGGCVVSWNPNERVTQQIGDGGDNRASRRSWMHGLKPTTSALTGSSPNHFTHKIIVSTLGYSSY